MTAQSAATSAPTGQRASLGSIARAGGFAFILSAIANVVIGLIIKPFVNMPIPAFDAMTQIIFTFIGVLGATIVFALVNRFARNPARLYRIIAYVVLVISLIPDLMFSGMGVPWVGIIGLMLMHVITAILSIELLTRTGR